MFTKEMYTAALHPGKVKVEIILPPDQAARIKRKLKGREWEEIKSKLKEASLAELQLRMVLDHTSNTYTHIAYYIIHYLLMTLFSYHHITLQAS